MSSYYSKVRNFLLNLSIFKKTFYGMTLIVIIIISFSTLLSYSYTHDIYVNRVFENAVLLVKALNRSMENDIDQIDRIIRSIYAETERVDVDDLIMKEIISTRNYSSLTEQYKALKVTNDFFYQLLYLREDFSNAYIYISPEKSFSYSISGRNRLNYDPKSEEWYRQTVEADGKTLIFPPHKPFHLNEYNSDVISFSKLLKNIDDLDGDPYGVILIDLSLKRIKQDIEDFAMDKPARVLFLDKEDDVIYSQNLTYDESEVKERIASEIEGKREGNFITTISDQKYLVAFQTSTVSGWKLLILTPYNSIAKEALGILITFSFLSIIGVLFSAIASYVFSKLLYKPIEAINSGIEKVREGDFHSVIQYESKDELGLLVSSFNAMVLRTRKMILERYEEKLARNDAEFKYLQAQINPHFIYNTLQTISSMAIVYKVPEINNVSKDLAKIMRYGIPTDDALVTVRQEIDNVRSYLEIQKIRFKDFLFYEIDVTEEAYGFKIVKLALQPIVENSIIHGLKMKESGGFIKITASISDDVLALDIEDNGLGMGLTELEYLMAEINKPEEEGAIHTDGTNHNHVGLRNINRRLKIIYGDEYGLQLESSRGEWTKVRLLIPSENRLVKEK